MAAPSASAPLVARSDDGSLIAVHRRESSSSSPSAGGTGLIRCHDGSVSDGSLKFTLRLPASSSSSSSSSSIEPAGETENAMRKLVFASHAGDGGGKDAGRPSHLCGALRESSSILIWDLDRGVLSATLDVRGGGGGAETPKKKKRKKRKSSSSSGADADGKEVLCDIAAAGDQLLALVLLPDSESHGSGKCRVYQYDLSGGEASLVKKIKVGSVSNASSGSFGIAVAAGTMAIRMGRHLRVLDSTTGEKLSKADIPAVSLLSNDEDGESKLEMSTDGRYVVVGSANNQAVLYSCNRSGGEDKQKLTAVALLSAKDDAPISHLDVALSNDGDLTLLAFQSLAGAASLFAISAKEIATSSPSLMPQMPQAQLKTDDKEPAISFIHAGFHPRRPDQEMTFLFQKKKNKGGSAAGSGTHLPMESLSYFGGSLEGTMIVGASLVSQDDAKGVGKKRKVTGDAVALAPGEQGMEASSAADLTDVGKTKKVKVKKEEGAKIKKEEGEYGAETEGEDDFGDLEEEGEKGQSIAERLALLSSAMEETDEEDDDEDDDEASKGRSKSKGRNIRKLKSATSATVTALLTQALSSNDPWQLNAALQVTDRRVVEGTVRALRELDAGRDEEEDDDGSATTKYVPALMAHLVRRMARKPSLATSLGVWVRAVLAATAGSVQRTLGARGNASSAEEERMAREGRELAAKLGPLRNFLNERVESFPQLLRLEGRLALLGEEL